MPNCQHSHASNSGGEQHLRTCTPLMASFGITCLALFFRLPMTSPLPTCEGQATLDSHFLVEFLSGTDLSPHLFSSLRSVSN
ncbi:hypothetical protein E2C01_034675 [Portunus trituberculatus]|uniref:Uncharacterized protein n=1 Tax=Portunus trituberculatus TaxID=210409 RepID=A0A5B7F7N0_PORTR|nr:hypothetical protein [Portunus trituberculatus]